MEGGDINWNRVARFYDAHVGSIAYDLAFWQKWAAMAAGGKVLELMCGTGRVSLPLLEAGVDLYGVDRSEEMTARLRQRLRGATTLFFGSASGNDVATQRIYDMDVRALNLLPQKFALIFVAFQSFCEVKGVAARRRVWAAACRHLLPGGRFILTFHNPMLRSKSLTDAWVSYGIRPLDLHGGTVEMSGRWWSGDSQHHEALGEQRYVERDETGTVVSEITLPMSFDLVSREEVDVCAHEHGLITEHVFGDYDESAFCAETSPYLIFVLRQSIKDG